MSVPPIPISIPGPEDVAPPPDLPKLIYLQYDPEEEEYYLPLIRKLIAADLSEPYSIYVYRYFLYQWGQFCYSAIDTDSEELIGVIICKLERHRSGTSRGYIAMLAVQAPHRGKGIASNLVRLSIDAMTASGADEIVLETEVDNSASLKLYQRLGFLRSKRLHRYYLNGNAAFRLCLYLKEGAALKRPELGEEGEGEGAHGARDRDVALALDRAEAMGEIS